VRFVSALLALGCLLPIAGAQSYDKTIQAQTAPTSARVVLEQMSPTERANSRISVEFESSDDDAASLARQVERLWNCGHYDEALVQLGNLEARVGDVAIGNSWLKPVPACAAAVAAGRPTPATGLPVRGRTQTGLWGRDVRIGNRDSLLDVSLAAEPSSRGLFVVLRRGGLYPHFVVCMSVDTGATWHETFSWTGSPPTSLDAAVLANHLYVVYNSPGEDAEHVRLRRFSCSDGSADTFRGRISWVDPCTLDVGDTMREVSLVANPNNSRLCLVALVSDGSVRVSFAGANAESWTRVPTGISSGARNGLDATNDQKSDTTCLFFSYYDASDSLQIYGRSGPPFSRPAGRGTPTSISAFCGTVICAYEDETVSPHQVRYVVSDGDTWTMGPLSDPDIAAQAAGVTVCGGDGFAAVFSQGSPTGDLRFCRRTDSGPWSAPVSIANNEPYWNRPAIEYLGNDLIGVAYLSNTSPVVRGAYFDRSDWLYGIAERRQPPAASHKPQATVVRGALLPEQGSSSSCLLDIGGRKVMELHAGANDVSRLAPGVYFVRAVSRELSAVSCSKVILTR
jgi:hypothetical protein